MAEFLKYEKPRDGIVVITMNRPERLNAMGQQLLMDMRDAWLEFEHDDNALVAILTGAGRAFCVGEDLKESVERGTAGIAAGAAATGVNITNLYSTGEISKPTIAAVHGWAVGGGVGLVAMATLRVAAKSAVFEYPQAKHWGAGAYFAGVRENLPFAIGAELALGFRISGQRAYEQGWVNRLVENDDEIVESALGMADHLVSLRRRTVLNTVAMIKECRPDVPSGVHQRGVFLRYHGLDDPSTRSDNPDPVYMETRRAFVGRH